MDGEGLMDTYAGAPVPGDTLVWTNSGIKVRVTDLTSNGVVFEWDNGAEGELPWSEWFNYLQPAPEPEPVYEIGHMYEADVNYVGRVQVMWTNGPPLTEDSGDPAEYPWFVPSEDDFFTKSVVTNVKPLVVLDPEVDVDGLKRVLASADYDYQAQAEAALKFLGLKE
jgi:hypothetical protein